MVTFFPQMMILVLNPPLTRAHHLTHAHTPSHSLCFLCPVTLIHFSSSSASKVSLIFIFLFRKCCFSSLPLTL